MKAQHGWRCIRDKDGSFPEPAYDQLPISPNLMSKKELPHDLIEAADYVFCGEELGTDEKVYLGRFPEEALERLRAGEFAN